MNNKDVDKSFRAVYLIKRYLQRSITLLENEELTRWLQSSEQNRQLFNELCSPEILEKHLQQYERTDTVEGWQRLQHKISNSYSTRQRKKNWKIVWRSAAAVFIVSLAAWQAYYHAVKKENNKQNLVNQYGQDVLPGTKKAQLLLSNGSTVLLDSNTDSLFKENGSSVQRHANGSLAYSRGGHNAETAFNTMYIPRGGEYMIVLEDGTRVWLNAATALRYPVQFTGKERRVELLEGEAYFEIAKNKEKPFIVIANRMKVQAIGTAFDVNIYANADSVVSTTLAEGKVKVWAGGNSLLLLPGRQVKADNFSATVVDADIEAVTGWKNGLFVFNNAPLQQVMLQLARWYDVRIEYNSRFKEQKFFTGEIKRNVPVSKLLQMMELTGIASFKINGNTILIQPYNK